MFDSMGGRDEKIMMGPGGTGGMDMAGGPPGMDMPPGGGMPGGPPGMGDATETEAPEGPNGTDLSGWVTIGKNIVKLYNPERYILDKNTEMPKYVRIINGTKDTDTSRLVSLNCCTQFVMRGVDATLAWSWDEDHVGADPLNTSFTAWLDGICRK